MNDQKYQSLDEILSLLKATALAALSWWGVFDMLLQKRRDRQASRAKESAENSDDDESNAVEVKAVKK